MTVCLPGRHTGFTFIWRREQNCFRSTKKPLSWCLGAWIRIITGNQVYIFHLRGVGVFFDKNQFVQGRTFPAWLRDAECRLVLHTNCRNTFEIADTSGRAIDLEAKVKPGSVSGDKPSIFTAETQRDAINILNKLISKYRLNDYRYDQICLVALGTQNRSILNGVEKIGSHKVFVDERRNDGVLFTTARKFKGLESDVVILLDASADTFRTDENRRLFYVGASRAKHNLDILFIGNEDGLVEAAENMTGKTVNARRAKAEIIKYLQVKIRSDQA